MLVEAASELFLENGYASSTIDQITQRAGVSRNTFFNYFQAKSDVLWAGLDESTERLADELASKNAETGVMSALRDSILRTAEGISPEQLPLAATQYEVMGAADEMRASGLPRFMRMATVIERFVTARIEPGGAGIPPQAIAESVTAAAVAGAASWAQAGVNRRSLADYVARAIEPVCAGYDTQIRWHVRGWVARTNPSRVPELPGGRWLEWQHRH